MADKRMRIAPQRKGKRNRNAIDGGVTRTPNTATGLSAIPPVPILVDSETRVWMESVRQALQVQAGQGRGDGLDEAVTFRDLGGYDNVSGLGTGSIYPSIPGDGGGGTGPAEQPTRPTGVVVSGGIEYLFCRWAFPAYEGHSHTKIYVQEYDGSPGSAPDYDNEAYYVSSAIGTVAEVRVDAGRYWVWLRHVNTNVQESLPSTAEDAVAIARPSDAIDAEWEDAVHEIERDTDVAWIDEIIGIAKTVGQDLDIGVIVKDIVIINDDLIAIGGAIGIVTEDIRVINGEIVIINEDIGSLEASVAVVAGDVLVNGDKIDVNTGRVSVNHSRIGYCELPTGQLGSSITREACWVEAGWTPPPDYDPDVPDFTPDPADPWLVLPLTTAMNGIWLDYCYIDFDGNEICENTAVTEWMKTIVDEQGRLMAQWGIKIDVGDLTGGIGITGHWDPDTNTGEIAFVCVADKFTVYHPTVGGGTPQPVFRITNGNVYMDNAYIDQAYINTIIAGTVNAEFINAININAINITGGTINIADSFIVLNNGNVEITRGSLNIADKFVVSEQGIVSIRDDAGNIGMAITNSQIAVYDASGVLRVLLGRLT